MRVIAFWRIVYSEAPSERILFKRSIENHESTRIRKNHQWCPLIHRFESIPSTTPVNLQCLERIQKWLDHLRNLLYLPQGVLWQFESDFKFGKGDKQNGRRTVFRISVQTFSDGEVHPDDHWSVEECVLPLWFRQKSCFFDGRNWGHFAASFQPFRKRNKLCSVHIFQDGEQKEPNTRVWGTGQDFAADLPCRDQHQAEVHYHQPIRMEVEEDQRQLVHRTHRKRMFLPQIQTSQSWLDHHLQNSWHRQRWVHNLLPVLRFHPQVPLWRIWTSWCWIQPIEIIKINWNRIIHRWQAFQSS